VALSKETDITHGNWYAPHAGMLEEEKAMTIPQTAEQAYNRIDTAIRRMSQRTPALSNVYEAFRELMAQQAAVKADSSDASRPHIELDSARYAQGVPVLDKDAFAVSWAPLKKAADRILPAMEKGFPAIRDQLSALKQAIEQANADSDLLAVSFTSGDGDLTCAMAEKLGIDSTVIEFVLSQLKKPFAEKVAESLPPLPADAHWHKGYCPLCGSWPELSYLGGKEGRRWLRCSLCGHEWTFMRTQCPFCGTDDLDKIELIFQEDRKYERAELCHVCKKYVVSMDLRELAEDVPHEAAALGLVYLDMLAQQRGFAPGAACAWNVIDE